MYDKRSPFAVTSKLGRRDSLSDSAQARLRAAIIDCELPPGAVVSEAELSTRFGFGLAAVRAALSKLTEAGWIAPDGRRGSKVLAMSAAHLADLATSRHLLEPALLHHAPPTSLGEELRLRAAVYQSENLHSPAQARPGLLHQERTLLMLVAQSVAAPRLRGWLIDTWDLCLRADRNLDREFGIGRGPLPLADLACALADADAPGAAVVLTQMRHEFELRTVRALSRSAAPLSHALGMQKPSRRENASSATPRPSPSHRPRSAKGDPA